MKFMNISRKCSLGHFETAPHQPAAQLILAANRRACDEFSDCRMPILLHNVLTTLSQLFAPKPERGSGPRSLAFSQLRRCGDDGYVQPFLSGTAAWRSVNWCMSTVRMRSGCA